MNRLRCSTSVPRKLPLRLNRWPTLGRKRQKCHRVRQCLSIPGSSGPHVGSTLLGFQPVWVDSGRSWIGSEPFPRIRPSSGEIWSRYAGSSPNLAERGAGCPNITPEMPLRVFSGHLARAIVQALSRAQSGGQQSGEDLFNMFSEFGRFRPTRIDLTDFGPTPTKSGPNSTKVGRCRPTLGQFCLAPTQVGPKLAKIRPNCDRNLGLPGRHDLREVVVCLFLRISHKWPSRTRGGSRIMTCKGGCKPEMANMNCLKNTSRRSRRASFRAFPQNVQGPRIK